MSSIEAFKAILRRRAIVAPLAAAALGLLLTGRGAWAQEPEAAALRAELAARAGAGQQAAETAEIERRLAILAAEIERLKLGEAAVEADTSEHGYGPAASKVYRRGPGLSIGGYGELLYQHFDDRRDDGSPAGRSDQADLLRAVVYVGYKFNDRLLVNTEVEYEHANTDEGEVAVEFAYLDYLHRPELNVRAGLLLLPMGFVNELHEPTVFLGTRRPDVERVILPTTWRENGFGLFGDVGPFTYRSYVVVGLKAEGFSAGGLRGGRQEGAESTAEDFAWVGRLDYRGVPGLLLGGAAYLGDSGQDLRDVDGRSLGVGTRIFEGHVEWRWRGLELRALAARAELADVGRLNTALGLAGSGSIGERLTGFYLQAGYDVLAARGGERALIPYARWESFNTQDAVPTGFAANRENDIESLTLGLAFKPIERLILKLDVQNYDNGAGNAIDQVSLALGYVF